MSSGYIYFYLGSHVAPDLRAFERMLERIGVYLENPGTSGVVVLSPTGEQVSSTRKTIQSELANTRSVSVQWWYSDSEDIYCRFNPQAAKGEWSVEFGLDGVTASKAAAFVEVIVEFFTSWCRENRAAALVVDKTGELEDVNWNAIIEGAEPLRCVPDLLIIPQDLVTPQLDGVREEISGCAHHSILRRLR